MRILMLLTVAVLTLLAGNKASTVRATTDFAASVRKGKVDVVFTNLKACEHYIVYEDCVTKELKCLNFDANYTYAYKPEYKDLVAKNLLREVSE